MLVYTSLFNEGTKCDVVQSSSIKSWQYQNKTTIIKHEVWKPAHSHRDRLLVQNLLLKLMRWKMYDEDEIKKNWADMYDAMDP